jgi:hypothetical protein
MLVAALAFLATAAPSFADPKNNHSEEATEFVHGSPAEPTEAWTLAAGGRIYDNWWEALDKNEPTGSHPAYPASAKKSGPATWRCKECHGWDYRGKDGRYGSGSHATGIKGIDGAKGADVAGIVKLLRGKPHGYTEAMISDKQIERVAAFVSRGQDDVRSVVNPDTGDVTGDSNGGPPFSRRFARRATVSMARR